LPLQVGYILIHLAEFDGASKAESSALKNYINPTKITLRRPYGTFNVDIEPQASCIASVNTNGFLKDSTGSRRFVVFPTLKMIPNHGVDMQQVYAQAYFLYLNGFEHWLTYDENQIQAEINSYFSEELASNFIIDKLELTGDEQGLESWPTIAEIIREAVIRKIIFYPPKEGELREVLLNKLHAKYDKASDKSAFRYSVKFK
jgi:hypothetical protein